MIIRARIDSSDEEVFIRVVDLDVFIHADSDSAVFVENENGEQWSESKGNLTFLEVMTNG